MQKETHCDRRRNCHDIGFLDQQLAGLMADLSDLGFGDRSAGPQLGNGSSGDERNVRVIPLRVMEQKTHLSRSLIFATAARLGDDIGAQRKGRDKRKAHDGQTMLDKATTLYHTPLGRDDEKTTDTIHIRN